MKKIIYLFSILTVLVACNDSDDGPAIPKGDYEDGIIIVNEGNFGQNNSKISFLKDNTVENEVFKKVNGRDLGDTAQSVAFEDNLAFIVLNASNTIEVVDRYTFKSITTITENLNNPRYITISDGYAYVTNWGDGSNQQDDFVTVIDLNNYATSTIAVDFGPEKILEEDDKIFVAHNGGWQYNNIVTVIDEGSKTVIKTITVGDVPSAMVEENDALYVVSSGMPSWSGNETAGAIHKINTKNLEVVSHHNFASGEHPRHLVEDNDKMYLTMGADVYQLSERANAFELTNLFSMQNAGITSPYGFNVIDGAFYIGDAKDYSSDGDLYILKDDGSVLAQYMVGVSPNGFYSND